VETKTPNPTLKLWAKPHEPVKKAQSPIPATKTTVSGGARTANSSPTNSSPAIKANETIQIVKTSAPIKKASAESIPELPNTASRNFDLTRPKINLYNFQKLIDYSLVPVEHNITLERKHVYAREAEKEEYTIPLRSMAVVGESGSGLSTLLANRALNNYRSNKPSIILAHGEHQLHSLAQTLLDCADPDERASLLNSIEFVTGNHPVATIDQNKKIYIVSTDKLSSYLEKNPSFRQTSHPTMTRGGQTWGQALAHQKLSEILPLYRAPELLVDDVHSYTGVANQGFTKVLATLLHEINSHTHQAVNIFGTSATPFARRIQDEQRPLNQGLTPTLQLEDFFPPNSRKQTPSANELIENLKHYKTPTLSLIQLDPEAQAALENTDAANRLLDASASSINAGIVTLYKPGKKWHIIANSRAQATQLCGLFNLQGIRARVLTSPETRNGKIIGHSGYFEESTNDSDGNFLELNDGLSSKMSAIKRSQENILNDYENGNCDVLIELDTPATHSTITDTVVDLTLRYDQANTHIKRLLGEAVRHPRKHDIEYIFLNHDNHQGFSQLISGQALELQPQGKGSSGSTDTTITPTVTPTSTTTNISRSGGIEHHKIWFNILQQKLDSRYPGSSLANQISKLVNDFKGKSTKTEDETKAIVLGLVKDTRAFRELVNFLELNAIETNIDVPDLMGVEEESVALRVLEKQYEIVAFSDAYTPNEPWLKRLDGALRLADNANGETRERYRLKLFSEILFKKFGKEVFENRSFLDHALRVFTGNQVDYRLFGLLVNALASNEPSEGGTGFSFSDIVKEFSELTGSRVQVPFSELQKQILERYPEPPENIDVFFRQGLYDDFSLDFGSLVDAVREESQDSDQKIIDKSVADEIQQFLKANYQAKAEQNMPVGTKLREDERLELELDLKSKDDLSTITKEILYSQLISKIWGHSAKLKIHEENFTIELGPDSLNLKEREPSSIESAIDIFQVNPDLAILYDHQDYDSAYDRMDIKTRLARSISNFIIDRHDLSIEVLNPLDTQPEKNDLTITRSQASHINPSPVTKKPVKFTKAELTEAQKREIQVLTGAISRENLTPADKKLLREFFQAKNIKIDKRLPQFHDRLGVETIQEAQLIIKDKLNRTKFDEKWVKKLQNFDNLISEFIFEKKKDIFNQDPKKLFELVSILSGDISQANKQEAQDLIREFVGFAQTKDSSITLINLLPEYHNLLGIKNLEELQKVILSFSEPTPESIKASNNQINKALELITNKLNLSAEELYKIAGIGDPSVFYADPLVKIIENFSTKLELLHIPNIQAQLAGILKNNEQAIMARNFLAAVYGENFKHQSSIMTIGNPQSDPYHLVLEVKGSDIGAFIGHNPKNDKSLARTRETIKNDYSRQPILEWADYQIYSLDANSSWELKSNQENPHFKYRKVCLTINEFVNNATTAVDEWFNQIKVMAPSNDDEGKQLGIFAETCDAFIRDQLKSKNNLLPKNSKDLVKETIELILSGPEPCSSNRMSQKDKQNLIRAFIEFTNQPEQSSQEDSLVINLQDVLEKTPKAVGVKTVEELKTVVQANRDLFKDPSKFITQVLQLTGLTEAEYLSFKDPNGFTESVIKVLKEKEEDLPKLASPKIQDLYKVISQSILKGYLFDHSNFISIKYPNETKPLFRLFISDNEIKIEGYNKRIGSISQTNVEPSEYTSNIIVRNPIGKWEKMDLSPNQKLIRQLIFNTSLFALFEPDKVDQELFIFIVKQLETFYKIYNWRGNSTAPYQFTNLLTRFYEDRKGIRIFNGTETTLLGIDIKNKTMNLQDFVQDMKDFLDFAREVEPKLWNEVEITDTIPAQPVSSTQPSLEDIKQQINAKPENFLESLTSDNDISVFEETLKKQFSNIDINAFYNYLGMPQSPIDTVKEGIEFLIREGNLEEGLNSSFFEPWIKDLTNQPKLKKRFLIQALFSKDITLSTPYYARNEIYNCVFDGGKMAFYKKKDSGSARLSSVIDTNTKEYDFNSYDLVFAVEYDFKTRTWKQSNISKIFFSHVSAFQSNPLS
jgi:hypothetical protein